MGTKAGFFTHIIRRYSILLHKMETHKIVPDIIDVLPMDLAEVVYPSGIKVKIGSELKPTDVKDPPKIKWKADNTMFYSVLFTDPDAPTRVKPVFREWQHWLVVNIPGTSIEKGEVLAEYIGAGPPKGSGLHRYVFLIFKQNEKITFKEKRLTKTSAANRSNFNTKNFITKYKLGEPIAGNFFEAQWDNYVPELYKQIGLHLRGFT